MRRLIFIIPMLLLFVLLPTGGVTDQQENDNRAKTIIEAMLKQGVIPSESQLLSLGFKKQEPGIFRRAIDDGELIYVSTVPDHAVVLFTPGERIRVSEALLSRLLENRQGKVLAMSGTVELKVMNTEELIRGKRVTVSESLTLSFDGKFVGGAVEVRIR